MSNSEVRMLSEQKKVYIYAEVDIDKAYYELTAKGKKIRAFL